MRFPRCRWALPVTKRVSHQAVALSLLEWHYSSACQICPYHSQGADSYSTNRSSGYQNGVAPGGRLHDGSDVEDDDDEGDCAFSRYPVRECWHEEASEEGTKLEHTGHKTFSKCSFSTGEDGVKLRHHVDDGDDTPVKRMWSASWFIVQKLSGREGGVDVTGHIRRRSLPLMQVVPLQRCKGSL